jgi:hypothetical protein
LPAGFTATTPFLIGGDETGKIQSAEKYFNISQISGITGANKNIFLHLIYFYDEMFF